MSTARKTKREALRKRISSLQNELGQTLEDNDPIWLSFGITPSADVKEKRRNSRRNSRRAKQLQRAAAEGPVGSAAAGEPTVSSTSTSDSASSVASSVGLNG